MDSVSLWEISPTIEFKNGLFYLMHKDKHAVAMQPNIAKAFQKRLKNALDELDVKNVKKIVKMR